MATAVSMAGGAQHRRDHRGGAHCVHDGLYLLPVQPHLAGVDIDIGHGVTHPQGGEDGQKGGQRHQHRQRQEQRRRAHGLQCVQRRIIRQRRPLQRTRADGAVGDLPATFRTDHFETLQNICFLPYSIYITLLWRKMQGGNGGGRTLAA